MDSNHFSYFEMYKNFMLQNSIYISVETLKNCVKIEITPTENHT